VIYILFSRVPNCNTDYDVMFGLKLADNLTSVTDRMSVYPALDNDDVTLR
jgi:hypothetical protein